MRRCLISFIFIFALCFKLDSAYALNELRENYLSTRAQAMGGAGIATDESEEATYHNPAGLAGFEKTQIYIPSCTLEASGGIYSDYSTLSSSFKSFSFSSLNALIGKTLDFRAQCAALFATRYFGISYRTDNQYYLSSHNIVMPEFIFGAQNTNGLQSSFGFPVWKTKRKQEIRVGIGLKMLYRRGGYYTLGMTELLSADRSLYAKTVGGYSKAYGADLGAQFINPFNKHFKLVTGFSYTDVGNTTFQAPANPISSNLTLGVAAVFRANALLGGQIAYDYKHALETVDWRKKNHIGIEVDLANVSVFAGMNQVYFTYGAAIDLWLLRLSLASYTEETGAWVHQNYDRRYLLKIDIKLNI